MDYPDPASGDTTTSAELKVKCAMRNDEMQQSQLPKVWVTPWCARYAISEVRHLGQLLTRVATGSQCPSRLRLFRTKF